MVIEELAQALRNKHYVVDTHVGRSRFRCDLAVRKQDSGIHQLGILVDSIKTLSKSKFLWK